MISGVINAIRASRYNGVIQALIFSNSISLFLYLTRMIGTGSTRYWFLLWNLLLAWLPLLLAWLLIRRLRHSNWLKLSNLALTALWIAFLPNSFYLVSDLIHLHLTGEVNILYDAVMFTSFIFNGYVAGFASLYLMHTALLKKLARRYAHIAAGSVLLACSYAIYLGRVLRWNTWDIVMSPFGILFDVSEQFINPIAHPQVLMTTATFFLLLASMYAVIWRFVEALRNHRR